MTDCLKYSVSEPQCQFFVVRKKRLCRMTVRPGRQYCGEHEPKPTTQDGQVDTRIPCPNDPKHTCYASRLEKHLSICNARQTEQPPYIEHNVNAPAAAEGCVRRPLSDVPRALLMRVIDKVNTLYDKHLLGRIPSEPVEEIHWQVAEEWRQAGRTERSRRHLRQASALLWLAERTGLVRDGTCYVELGAGKGQLSYYMGRAWCGRRSGSGVVLVDRAALRHKRDNKLRAAPDCGAPDSDAHDSGAPDNDASGSGAPGGAVRLRADLAHLVLALVPGVAARPALVGVAKHLCGVATDYALRCVTAASASGVLLATCCHHRCRPPAYVAARLLQELGVSGEELNVILGVVSWATCGDGRSRDHRRGLSDDGIDRRRSDTNQLGGSKDNLNGPSGSTDQNSNSLSDSNNSHLHRQADVNDQNSDSFSSIDEKYSNSEIQHNSTSGSKDQQLDDLPDSKGAHLDSLANLNVPNSDSLSSLDAKDTESDDQPSSTSSKDQDPNAITDSKDQSSDSKEEQDNLEKLTLTQEYREEVGRRAKALLDWGRVLYLREKGFDARLCYFVPASVSLENMCIVATRKCS